jgi:peroxiredoxin Q/BCP
MRSPVPTPLVGRARVALAALAAALTLPSAAAAQGTPAAAAAAPIRVGALAPDFTLPGATRYGRLTDPVRLAELRGQTVVIAFFYRARTKG